MSETHLAERNDKELITISKLLFIVYGVPIEIGGLECALYCFAFVWYVIPMRSKDGSNTLAKECYGPCCQMVFSIYMD